MQYGDNDDTEILTARVKNNMFLYALIKYAGQSVGYGFLTYSLIHNVIKTFVY